MTILSTIDPSADIACNLPVNEGGSRLAALQVLIGRRMESSELADDKLRIRLNRAGDDDLEAKVTAWAQAEKDCCAFLGFTIESEPDAVVLEIAAPMGAQGTLDGLEWIVWAAGQASA
jgi:hypothetical protein